MMRKIYQWRSGPGLLTGPLTGLCMGLLALAVLTGSGCELFGGRTSSVRLLVTGLPRDPAAQALSYAGASGAGLQAATAPAGLRSLALTVSGPEMSTLSYYYNTIPESITLEVPAGKAREFNLTISTVPGHPTALLNYRGTATVDLPPGGTATVALRMTAGEAKLVIPDFLGGRLVITDNMRGDGWVSKTAADFSLTAGAFRPYDVDFDARGNLYIANHPVRGDPGDFYPLIMTVTDINKNLFLSGLYTGTDEIVSLAVDRERNYLYYLRGVSMTLKDLTNNVFLTPAGPLDLTALQCVAVGKDGMVYIGGLNGASANVISKYSITPSAGTYTANLINSQVLNFEPFDILVRDNYLLVSSHMQGNEYGLFKMDPDLKNPPVPRGRQIEYYTIEAYNPPRGYFYEPTMFFGVTNSKIYLIDDSNYNQYFDANRIVAFDNPDNWQGWSTFRGFDAGQTPFRFYFDYSSGT